MGSLQKIDHIVVLMLENRSFNSLLGTLYPKSDSFEGLTGDEQNGGVWPIGPQADVSAVI
jgi:phospholipase C